MEAIADSRRVAGALRFLADLHTVAAECAAQHAPSDEIAARRRQRNDARAAGGERRAPRKAL